MADTLSHFFHMNGHGVYIWTAYATVTVLLAAQWYVPWRRWHRYRRLITGSPSESNPSQ